MKNELPNNIEVWETINRILNTSFSYFKSTKK